ncbi:MAG TPA: EamA family transporter [Candidatus Eisenbacteria bacterium]|nr:EamA family transporter [Candidatus Eisenbacteria bacterium]
MSAPRSSSPWAAFAGCSLIWGTTFLVIRLGEDSVPPVWAAALRLALAGVLLAGIVRVRRTRWPRGPALRAAMIYGLLNFGVNFPLLYWGETRFPSGLSAVMYATNPLTIALMARAIGLERLPAGKVIGALVAFAGVVLISGGVRGATLAGAAAVFTAALTAAMSTLALKRAPHSDPFGTNAVGCAVGFPVCLAVSFALREPHALPHGWPAWGALLYLVVAGSLVAFVLMTWLIHHWPASRAAYVGVVVPIVAMVVGAAVHHERVGAAALAGSAIVLAGVMIGLRASAPAITPSPAPVASDAPR